MCPSPPLLYSQRWGTANAEIKLAMTKCSRVVSRCRGQGPTSMWVYGTGAAACVCLVEFSCIALNCFLVSRSAAVCFTEVSPRKPEGSPYLCSSQSLWSVSWAGNLVQSLWSVSWAGNLVNGLLLLLKPPRILVLFPSPPPPRPGPTPYQSSLSN